MKLKCPQNQLSQIFAFCIILQVLTLSVCSQNNIKSEQHFTSSSSSPLPKSLASATNLNFPNAYDDESQRSSRLKCPASGIYLKYRYDEQMKKCGIIGQQAHCSENMVFYSLPGSAILGQCDCSKKLASKPLIYHPKTKKCYFTYEQSYCRPRQWLTFNQYGNVVCTKNKCWTAGGRIGFGTKSEEVEDDLVPFKGNGECVKLYGIYKQCKSDEIVTFVSGHVTPQCGPKGTFTSEVRVISPVTQEVTCAPGSFLSVTGRCLPPFVW